MNFTNVISIVAVSISSIVADATHHLDRTPASAFKRKKQRGNMKSLGFLGLVTGLFLLIAACGDIYGGATPPGAPISTEPPFATEAPSPVPEGLRLFTANGCSACHGANGEGTAIAPGLAGHTGSQVTRQARAPVGQMPVFPPLQISNAELAQIAEYIESLGGDHLHVSSDDSNQSLTQHHWMILFALEDESPVEAVHHVDHIISLVVGQHLAQMNEAKEEIEAGDFHDGGHIIENMLAGVQVEDLTPSEMHSSMARSSALIGDSEGALHHLDHISDALGADPASEEHVAEVRELLESGELTEAAHELEELVGEVHAEEHQEEEEHGH